MYKNHNSLLKHRTRLEVLKQAEKIIKKQGRVSALTLPSSNFIFEQLLLDRNPQKVQLDCVERDKTVYIEASGKAERKEGVRLFNADVFEFLRTSDNKYNFLWLDLCGPMSQSNILNILSLVQAPVLDKSGYLAVTLMAAREPKAKEMEEFYGTNMEVVRTSIFPDLVKQYAGQVGRKVKVDPILHYRSELKLKSAPMNVYGFSFT